LLLISLPIAVGGTCVADSMMLWLTPELGAAGGTVFTMLLWSLPFIYANFLLGTILNATDRQRLNVRASAWGLISNAVFNIPAIYYYGAYGACIATTLSQGLYCIIMLKDTREYHLFENGWSYGSILFSCLLMYITLAWISWAWYWSIPLGMAVYLVSLLATRGIAMQDIRSLRKAVMNK
jgi:O-antigen/teichoic acid export membrane protein